MRRLHEWKDNKLTLRGLTVSWRRGKRKLKAATTYSNKRRCGKKSAEVIVSRKRAAPEKKRTKAEVSPKDEGLNVRMGEKLESLW